MFDIVLFSHGKTIKEQYFSKIRFDKTALKIFTKKFKCSIKYFLIF